MAGDPSVAITAPVIMASGMVVSIMPHGILVGGGIGLIADGMPLRSTRRLKDGSPALG